MRVLYDITTLANIHSAAGVYGAGIFRATESLGLALAKMDGIELFVSSASGHHRKAIRYLSETGKFGLSRFAIPFHGRGDYTALGALKGSQLSEGTLKLVEEYLDTAYAPERIYNPGRFDVYHVNWRGESRLPANSFPAIVLTVFDVIALKRPEWFVRAGGANPIGDYLSRLLGSVGRQHLIVVNTASVKADLTERFSHISQEQVHVVPLGVSESLRPATDQDQIAETRAKYGIPTDHRYVLCVNTLEPRKNMTSVIEAYSRLVTECRATDLSLVLVGSKGWNFDDIIAKTDGLAAESSASVIVTGYVPDSDMAPIYSGASLFCYPSLDEGFGLPVLEAMKCGVPVITSARPPFVEVAGDAALFVEPEDVTGLAAAMERVLEDDATAETLRKRGEVRASNYTWDRSAAALVKVYEKATHMRGGSAGLSVEAGVQGDPSQTRLSELRSRVSAWEGSLADAKNLYRGKRIFILGAAESLGDVPLGLLKDEYTLAVNSFYTQYDNISWKPTIYFVAGETLDAYTAGLINGLTGSMFVFDSALKDELRSGSDVIWFDRDECTSFVSGVDLFEYASMPRVVGPELAMISAIQIAYHLGFEPIYLVSPEVDVAWGLADTPARRGNETFGDEDAARERVRDWHRSGRDAFHRRGRQIFSLSRETPFDTYRNADVATTFVSRLSPEYQRKDKAHVDETEVIAWMFRDGTAKFRTMVDVGAHRGTSAKHFLGMGWSVYCFEPDPENREHLVKRLGHVDRLIIDARAIGDTPAARVPFFRSKQSSGISGLSAFHESHELIGHVEVTTIHEVVDEYEIAHVDFLKIDVEGHDFDVLKGVPWDRMEPDVIECEFEDAKTVPLGYTMRDVADFLREKGYSLYVSEWHPVVRYGIRHDWKRVVPYPGFYVPPSSWGNILAFKTDPGYDRVREGFALLVDAAGDRERTDRAAQVRGQEMIRPKRAFYADFGDRLRSRSPQTYAQLRFIRRALVWLWRRKKSLLSALSLLVALTLVGFAVADTSWRYAIWIGTAFFGFAFATFALGAYTFQVAQRQAMTTKAMERLKADSTKSFASIEGNLDRLREAVDDLRRSLDSSKRGLTQIDDLRERVIDLAASSRQGADQLEVVSNRLGVAEGRLQDSADKIEETKSRIGDLSSGLGQIKAGVVAELEARQSHSNYSNAPGIRMHTRWLASSDVDRLQTHWLKLLGLSMSDRELRYLAHKICLDEERCEGRLATTIQAAVLRALVLLALKSESVELLEIGVLSGISAGSLYRVGERAQRKVSMTLIDPLGGYYDESWLDRQTGVPVTKKTVIDNLSALGVESSRFRIIQVKSSDMEAVKEASDRSYDVLLIDGDHSLQGISSDFKLYSSLVRPGGMLIFDDYDSPDWPSIKKYVDEKVRPLDEWLWIGGEWHTGVFQRKPKSE